MSIILSKNCRKCGATIFGQIRVCSACMLETALQPFDDDIGDSAAEARANGTEVEQVRSRLPVVAFGDYELLEEIGRGGQGVVYRARQKSLKRTVALKVIGLGQWSSTLRLKRFRQEAEAAATLEHPQIVPIYEIGERDGSCYFSMKFVEGGQLDAVLKREPISPRRAAELLGKIARTVQFAHEHGILHRDIKPGNILLDRKGELHLTDFGLARLIEQDSTITNSSDVLGTPSYMPPEQAAGDTKQLTAAADVYSLGAVFYHMLTGEPPFCGSTGYETIRMVLENEPRNPRTRNPKIDADLATICLKCLEKNPARRYESAEALATDVERWLRREPIQARRAGVFVRGKKWLQRNPATAITTFSVIGLVAAMGAMIWNADSNRRSSGKSVPAPDKSIAVLPFENLSEEKANEFFADGVQDEILTDLARIADLKVISRTSVMQYKSGALRNLRKIGQELGVAHVLEGSVQRAGHKVRINAQLIDARNDAHLWAQTYYRDLADVFVIQSEIAKTIADQLQAKLSPQEKSAIERPPTNDLVAFGLYTRAKAIPHNHSFDAQLKPHLLEAADLLDEAIKRDPGFVSAYCVLAYVHDQLYFLNIDHTPARLALADAALQNALRLQPDAGEVHLALASHYYRCFLDYDRARSEIAIARRTLPNDPTVFELLAYIDRRQGRWEDCVRNFELSIELDPRNYFIIQQAALTYQCVRDYSKMAAALDRALEIVPNDVNTIAVRGLVDLLWRADTRPLHTAIDDIIARNSVNAAEIADQWVLLALCERDISSAERALTALGTGTFGDDAVGLTADFGKGLLSRMRGDADAARAAFTAARAQQEKKVHAEPDYGPNVCVLALIDAGLGRKKEALDEGKRAIELLPVDKDAVNGPHMIEYFAITCAWLGENDLAFENLAKAAKFPGDVSFGELKLDPRWDPLRGDPRFEKIVSSLAPKEKSN